jgi:hypothetical protein
LARPATTVLVLLVVAGSAAAFAISEGLKVQRATITAVKVGHTLSPVCNCLTDRVTIAFGLTRADRLTVSILGPAGQTVRTLVRHRLLGVGKHHFTWNGRNDSGAVVPEGSYLPKVRLERTDKTIVMPNPIVVDTTPPRIAVVSVRPRIISPDGDGHSDVLRVAYRIDEHAHAVLYVNGIQRARTLFQRTRDSIDWYGKVDGRVLPPGIYRLALRAVDLAGNRSQFVLAGTVTIRFVELPHLPAVVVRSRVVVPVSTDAPRVRYTLRHGSSVVASGTSPRRLVLRAPRKPGRFVLVVTAAGHSARGTLVVRKR